MADINFMVQSIITADGQTYDLTDAALSFVTNLPGGWGTPPVDFETRRPYNEDAEIVVEATLQPREFGVRYFFKGEPRHDVLFFAIREQLMDILRFNRNAWDASPSVVTYTVLFPDGSLKAIDGIAAMSFSEIDYQSQGLDTFVDVMTLTAYNPTFYDFDSVTAVGQDVLPEQLHFPLWFDDGHIYFESAGFFDTFLIQYDGTYRTRPVMVATGPLNFLIVTHVETRRFIRINFPLLVGQSIIIDLDAGTIKTNWNMDLKGYLDPLSDMQNFYLWPNPQVSGGLNTILVDMSGIAIDTDFQLTYRRRYIGL